MDIQEVEEEEPPSARDIKRSLSVRCTRSIMPFDWGWYAVVMTGVMPNKAAISFHKDEVNCRP